MLYGVWRCECILAIDYLVFVEVEGSFPVAGRPF